MNLDFQLFSDLHLELRDDYPKIIPTANLLILAGDIGNLQSINYRNFIQYCSLRYKMIFIVLGNHEFYHFQKSYRQIFTMYQKFFDSFHNIILLNNNHIIYGTYVFYGSTMWTSSLPHFLEEKINKFSNTIESFDHLRSFQYFLEEYKNSPLKKIIITHFPVLRNDSFVHEKYLHEPLERKKYFCNNYLHLFPSNYFNNILCFISGHTHHSYDLIIDNKRFLSNQYGYPHDSDENFQLNTFFTL